eukprot:403360806
MNSNINSNRVNQQSEQQARTNPYINPNINNNEEDFDEEHQDLVRPKKKGGAVDYQDLPESATLVKCPYCKHEGLTKISKNKTQQCKRVFFYIMMGIIMTLCFVIVIFYMILHLVICSRNQNNGRSGLDCCDAETGCCCFKGCFKGSGKCAPKVTFFHSCQKCNKIIGSSH